MLRDGTKREVPAEDVVRGDVVLPSAGNLAPADRLILEARDFLVSQAALTGETFPVKKRPTLSPADAEPSDWNNVAFLGTSARSGTARLLVVTIGTATEFGAIAGRLAHREPETEVERGLKRFGMMLTRVMTVVVALVFGANRALGRPVIDGLPFSIALAVGLTPELLPAIVSITMAAGARRMATHGVIVRRTTAIENLDSAELLCTDKTGTLTPGVL